MWGGAEEGKMGGILICWGCKCWSWCGREWRAQREKRRWCHWHTAILTLQVHGGSSQLKLCCNDVQKSFYTAISAVVFFFFICHYFLLIVFKLDFGENVDFVWGGSCWRRYKMQGLVLVRSNLKCLCNFTSPHFSLCSTCRG